MAEATGPRDSNAESGGGRVNAERIAGLVFAMLVAFFVFTFGFKIGYDNGRADAKRAAVTAGHAEYYVDAKTFERAWRWRTNCGGVKP